MEKIGDIKAVLFDLDDTLVNSKKAEYNAICEFKKIYKEFDRVKDEEFAKTWSKITTNVYEIYHQGKISFEELRIERMKGLFNNYSIDISEKISMKKFNEYSCIYEKNWTLFDDAIEVLEYLKNKYKLLILSNGDGIQQRKKIEYTGLNKYFSDIVISGEAGFSKPDREIFEISCKRLRLPAEKCVMIGDKFKVDIEGSLNAGMNGIWVNRKKEDIDYVFQVNELNELIEYL